MFRKRGESNSGDNAPKKINLGKSDVPKQQESQPSLNMFSHAGGPGNDSDGRYKRGARSREDNNQGGGEDDADLALVREQYAYSIKLHVNRIRGLGETQSRGGKQANFSSFDKFLLTWLFYYEDRGARYVRAMLETNIRLPVAGLEDLLCDVADIEFDSFVSQLADIEECHAGSLRMGGQTAAGGTSGGEEIAEGESVANSPGSIWKLAIDYLTALKAVRLLANHSSQFRMEEYVEDQVLELLRSHRGRLHTLIAQLQVLLLALESTSEEEDDAVPSSSSRKPQEKNAPPNHLDSAFLEAAFKMATLERGSGDLAMFHDSHFIQGGADSLPAPPSKQDAAMVAQMEAPDHVMTVAESTVIMERSGETLGENEEIFTEEVANPSTSVHHLQPGMTTHDESTATGKKKPQRFAKVQTGYHWTSYNRAHYDYKNPPPKVVMSYEFTLKYPECANNRKPPSYRLEDVKGDEDHRNLIFTSNSPLYEDVTYRIINKKWQGRGGKCTFNHYGELKLFFRFESSSYRR